jgi:hypothetical protein
MRLYKVEKEFIKKCEEKKDELTLLDRIAIFIACGKWIRKDK